MNPSDLFILLSTLKSVIKPVEFILNSKTTQLIYNYSKKYK